VFDRHFARYHHLDRLDLGLASTMTAAAKATTSFICYVMCLEARFLFLGGLSPFERTQKLMIFKTRHSIRAVFVGGSILVTSGS
jgi:hypothetical protein